MTAHKALSPSKAHRWLLCPGSVREEAKYPDTRGASAIDGTHSHTLLEHALRDDVLVASFLGKTLEDHDGKFLVTVDRVQRVALAQEYISTRTSMLKGGVVVISEQKVSPEYYLGRSDVDGTCDVRLVAPEAGVIEIIDYKDGIGIVEPKDNPQLELYALGALAELKMATNKTAPYSQVTMTIVQPKMLLKGMEPIKSHTVSVKELMAKIPKYVVGAMATDAPDAPLYAGDHCKFCKHAGACNVYANKNLGDAGLSFPVVAATPDLTVQAVNDDPATMTDEKLVQLIEAAPALRQMLEKAEEEAQRRLEAGQSVKGLKLVNGRGSSAWAIPDDQVVDKLVKMGVPKSAVYESKLVSPAKAKKLSWTKIEAGQEVTKSLSDRQIKTLEQEYVTKLVGKPTVALESDPRPALVRDVSAMFGAVEEAKAAPSLPSWLM